MGCFDDRKKVVNVLKKLKEEDLGMSVVVTGLRDKVEEICAEAGLTPHSADLALGIFGDTDKLPDEDTMCYTTMCGHAMISAGLVKQIRKAVTEGRMGTANGGPKFWPSPATAAFSILLAQKICCRRNETRLTPKDNRSAPASQGDSAGVHQLCLPAFLLVRLGSLIHRAGRCAVRRAVTQDACRTTPPSPLAYPSRTAAAGVCFPGHTLLLPQDKLSRST